MGIDSINYNTTFSPKWPTRFTKPDNSVGHYAGDIELNRISEKFKIQRRNINKRLAEYNITIEKLRDMDEINWEKFDSQVKQLYEKDRINLEQNLLEQGIVYRRSDLNPLREEMEREYGIRRPQLALPEHTEKI
jgi:hypothetical protein